MSDYDYSTILNRLLNRVDNKYDKRQGSIIYMMLAPVALEFAKAYFGLQQIQDEAFADTASRYYLEKRAKERNFYPTTATKAVMKGKFNRSVDYGMVFSAINSELNYTVGSVLANTDNDDYYYYELICTTAGSRGHSYTGNIVPVESSIEGLSTAQIVGIITHGTDDETTEHFRARYLNSFSDQAFGGNIADYKQKMKEISPDIGGVKVFPMWETNDSKIKIIFTNADYNIPSKELIKQCQNNICPTPFTGVGSCPIGHDVAIEGVKSTDVDISVRVTYVSDEYSWNDVLTPIWNVIENYFNELNADFENVTNIVIRKTHIESRILNVTGIADVEVVTLNSQTSNLTLPNNRIAEISDIYEVS